MIIQLYYYLTFLHLNDETEAANYEAVWWPRGVDALYRMRILWQIQEANIDGFISCDQKEN